MCDREGCDRWDVLWAVHYPVWTRWACRDHVAELAQDAMEAHGGDSTKVGFAALWIPAETEGGR